MSDSGSATVEFALALPSVVVVLALALSAGAWGLRVEAAQRGASEAARAAITEDDAVAIAAGSRVAGGATVVVSRAGGYVTACATSERPPWPSITRCAVSRERR